MPDELRIIKVNKTRMCFAVNGLLPAVNEQQFVRGEVQTIRFAVIVNFNTYKYELQ